MGYIIYALVFFFIYYFVEQKILKVSLVKAGKKFSEIYKSNPETTFVDLASIRKKTYFYRLQGDNMVFKSLNKEKPDLAIAELDYKDLLRFKKIIEHYKDNELIDHEFFIHKKHKHLIYPYFQDNDSQEILLIATYSNTINDVFDRNPRRS